MLNYETWAGKRKKKKKKRAVHEVHNTVVWWRGAGQGQTLVLSLCASSKISISIIKG
jgi:hypothetical protein